MLFFFQGWTMQMARFAYICRKWEKDEKRFNEILTYLGNHSLSTGSPYQMILFPEGTNFTSATKKKSLKYGEANNLKPLNHLLHPRTTGFTYIVQKMRESKFIEDLTSSKCCGKHSVEIAKKS